MFPYFYETKTVENGELILQNLPFVNGDKVDIILLKHSKKIIIHYAALILNM